MNQEYFRKVKNWVQHLSQTLRKKISLVQSTYNGGYTQGNNLAFKYSSGKYLLILNPDMRIGQNFLLKAKNILEKHNWGVLGTKIYINLEQKIIQATRNDIIKYNPLILFLPRGFGEYDNGQYDRYFSTFYASGGCFIVRRDLFQKLRGFDENYFMYTEEVDLCYRARMIGESVIYCPTLIAEHNRSLKNSLFTEKLIIRNNLFFLGKFFSIWILFIQFLFNFIRILLLFSNKSKKEFDKRHFISLFHASIEGLTLGLKYKFFNKL